MSLSVCSASWSSYEQAAESDRPIAHFQPSIWQFPGDVAQGATHIDRPDIMKLALERGPVLSGLRDR